MTPLPKRRFVIDMYSSRYPLWCMPEEDSARIRAALPADWELIEVEEEADGSGDGVPRRTPALLAALADAEVYVGFGIPREVFECSDRIRWVHSGAAGVGGSLYPEMRESDVIFTNSSGTHGVPMAEHAIAMMFYFARALDHAEVGRRQRRWNRDPIADVPGPVRELTDSVVGIIGYGGIGRDVGRRAKGLGMRVWAVKRHPDQDYPEVERLFGPTDLHEVLAGSDYVVLTVPSTPETEGLIGAAALAGMKREAVLVNVARGTLVDEAALVEALRSRSIRGAGLDVFVDEPLPASSPLWELDNVCLTPHVGGVSPRFWARETELIIENLRRYLKEEPLLNVVDKQAGY
ncbi:MAG: D-2-hydroxyacid dehydrogenase [Gemmatimonadetes bacterium]|uniref:D-2-hydroxyacid dehydrogenase n=1 Tax=Candidatus Kutchimonas denitrificans TaxID=3056748 RepID=A0AAE4ZBH2_9BACT|nr:D-2-hydroxyacid dehydrogenase [Gemmatimonadota bacterium]NIR76137.1 D-2-hydroxyacid dehydrogenase [Candidatus Kutchimonas denitrificans]NIS00516.1 D-2-hydroxyacid dehydrogenase [Gemmatimonadota bacterium]NIT66174.1 D-2-hydroxyacid dehydrogenase [Gemmatimonadota bacterium]NIU54252.1 D-2-hydroxyacid dehydrogenase [Gemmatimonadota bacterium]